MVGIIGAMEEEIKALKEKIQKRSHRKIGPVDFFQGSLEGQEVVLAKSGVGKVAGALAAALMIENYQPKWILNTGSAGGVKKHLKIGDLVMASSLVYHDVEVQAFGYKPGQLPGLPEKFEGDLLLQQKVEKAFQALKEQNHLQEASLHRGTIATGDQFITDPLRIKKITETFDASAVEMEGAGAAHSAWAFGTPFLGLRAISDMANSDSPVDFPVFLKYACENFTRLITFLLSQE